MKKAARHETCSMSHPPRTGPTAIVIEVNADQVPIARPRSSFGNEVLMMARLPGTSSAPPIPCNARAAIKCVMLGANPHQMDAIVKSATPEL